MALKDELQIFIVGEDVIRPWRVQEVYTGVQGLGWAFKSLREPELIKSGPLRPEYLCLSADVATLKAEYKKLKAENKELKAVIEAYKAEKADGADDDKPKRTRKTTKSE